MDESYSPHPVRNNGVMTNWNDLSFLAVANQFLHFIGLEAMRQTMSSLFSGDISDLTLSSSLQSITLFHYFLYINLLYFFMDAFPTMPIRREIPSYSIKSPQSLMQNLQIFCRKNNLSVQSLEMRNDVYIISLQQSSLPLHQTVAPTIC